MNEAIDKSFHIPRGENIVTPERLAKGDVAYTNISDCGEVLEIQLTVNSLLNYLREQDIINDDNLWDGQTFELWQMIWKAARGLERTNASLPRNSTDERYKEYGYSLIIRRMGRGDLNVIESAIYNQATDLNKFIAQNRKETYRRAFEQLSAILPPIREKIDALEANKMELGVVQK